MQRVECMDKAIRNPGRLHESKEEAKKKGPAAVQADRQARLSHVVGYCEKCKSVVVMGLMEPGVPACVRCTAEAHTKENNSNCDAAIYEQELEDGNRVLVTPLGTFQLVEPEVVPAKTNGNGAAAKPIKAGPGTFARIQAMQERAERGEPLFQDGDAAGWAGFEEAARDAEEEDGKSRRLSPGVRLRRLASNVFDFQRAQEASQQQ